MFTKKQIIYLGISGFFLLLFVLLNIGNNNNRYFRKLWNEVQQNYSLKEKKASEELANLSKKFSSNYNAERCFRNNIIYYNNLAEQEGISLFVFQKGELCFWSDNQVPFQPSIIYDPTAQGIIVLQNGYYSLLKETQGDFTFLALINIKNKYGFQNKYLRNTFHHSFGLPDKTSISLKPAAYDIYSNNGKFLFSLDFSNVSKGSWLKQYSLILFLIISVFFIIAFLLSFAIQQNKKSNNELPFILFIALLWLGRFLMFKYQIPSLLFELESFSPKLFASSSFFPSFAALLINVTLIFFSIYLFFKYILPISLARIKNRIVKTYSLILLAILSFLFTNFTSDLFRSIILNSSISFDVSNILEFTRYSFAGFLAISIILLCVFFLFERLIIIWLSTFENINYIIKYFAFSFLLYIAGCLVLSDFCWVCALFVLILWWTIFFIRKHFQNISLFYYSLTLISLFSLFSTFILVKTNRLKEQAFRKTLAMNLSVEHDPITEFAFMDIEGKITQDSILKSYLSDSLLDEERIKDHLYKRYFKGHWLKYDIQITICRPNDSLLLKPENIQVGCFSLFGEKLKNSIPTFSCDLYYIDKGTGRISYIANLGFPDSLDYLNHTKIFVEFDSKFVPKGLGYPELLVDERVPQRIDLSRYSYAKYHKGIILSMFGKYQYSYRLPKNYENIISEDSPFIDDAGYNHLIHKIDDDNLLIISKPNPGLLYTITPFSYLFTFFSLIVFFILFVRRYPFKISEITANYKGRIQVSMMSLVVVTLILIGVSSTYYILNIFNNKNLENVKEKTFSILSELENTLAKETILDASLSNLISDNIIRLSNVFFTDINVYDTDGNLLASSRNKIFDEGLLSEKINPVAYRELLINDNSLYVHSEKIGSIEYMSVYAAFRNNINEITGYINLPYFSKQHELTKELSTFIVAIINIYVLLFGLALVVALFVSRFITRPLKLLKDKMSKIQLGSKSEPIEWAGQDEIGSLIKEYNRMVEELLKSAELLAKSERESAWREMAKQVAHEIKNPLTPMKLSIQQLERAWKEKAPDWEERLNRFTKTMIEQIDTLSNIASAFSDFARLPVAHKEKINIAEIINHSIELFRDVQQINFITEINPETSFIFADRKLMLQAMNNLIKNAIQAIPEDREPQINIRLSEVNDSYIIAVEDNGCGIPEESKSRIFSPYFTTKTGGTGLGLAMTKNIIEEMGGKLYYETKINTGTVFFINLQKFS